MNADEVIARLGLVAHPEGGVFRETWRDSPPDGRRGSGTAIYFLLRAGERSRWHRVDAAEIWHFYAGAALELEMIPGGGEGRLRGILGPSLAEGQRPQLVVPANAWQQARSLGEWSLVGCTVSPAFDFGGFEIAPEEFRP